jgi:predicted ArsR family transcriptional regulator
VSEETHTRAGRQRRDRLPRNRQRERVLAMVREHDGAIDAVELAGQIGLHITTVRFHLDALCDEGAVERTRLNRPGKGRPRTGYRAVQQRVDYRTLAEVLAMELGQNVETRARRAQHAGQKWAARMATSQETGTDVAEGTSVADADDVLDRAAVRTTVAFTGMGFAPELAAAAEPTKPSSGRRRPAPGRERIILLHACPVRDLARSRPEVVCGMHRGLLQGLLDKTAAEDRRPKSARPAMSAHLEPFVEPELCVARLVSGE